MMLMAGSGVGSPAVGLYLLVSPLILIFLVERCHVAQSAVSFRCQSSTSSSSSSSSCKFQ